MEANSEKEEYNPADDDNQGVVQQMAQAERATEGEEQAPQMAPEDNE